MTFPQVNLESNFTPIYGWLDTVESVWSKSEYLYELGLIFVCYWNVDAFRYIKFHLPFV